MEIKERLFFTRRKLLDKRLGSFMEKLYSAQKMTHEDLADLNWSKRKILVDFAFENIPFYKRRFSEVGYRSGDLKSEKDFKNLPILEREDVRNFASEIVNPKFDIKTLPAVTTGGSTGVPLRSYADPDYPLHAISWRTLGWWGVHPYDNSAYLYRAVPSGWKKMLQKGMLYPTRRSFISALDMSSTKMYKFYKELLFIAPRYLVGYVGAIDIFANFLNERGLSIPGIKAIWTTAAPLPQIKRKYFQDIFRCPVYTQYGSCEFYWIASECKMQSGLHIANDVRHIDIDSPDGVGDILVTDLINYSFPFIRYRLGDRAKLLKKRCECGLPFPLLDYVYGRSSDIIYLKNRMAVPGEFWTTIFDDYVGVIKSFQVHQHEDYKVEIKFEPYSDDYQGSINRVRNILESKLGSETDFIFTKQHVNANDNGKFRFIISDISLY